MKIYRTIKEIREKLGLTQSEFAKKLGISEIYVITLEKAAASNAKRRPIPSEGLLKSLAELATNDEIEKSLFYQELLYERAKLVMPAELELYLNRKIDSGDITSDGMPSAFISRITKDIKQAGVTVDNLFGMELSGKELQLVLERRLMLSRKQVISLAMLLNQPVEEYLLLADYMPDSIKNVVTSKEKKTQAFFRKLGSLPPEDVDAMVDVFEKIYAICKREGTEGVKNK